MNILPLLALGLAGCAAPTEQLIQEATECVDNYISPQGVMGKPTDQDRQACWVDVNTRMEAEQKREEKKALNQVMTCPSGSTLWCRVYSKTDKRCGCVRRNGF